MRLASLTFAAALSLLSAAQHAQAGLIVSFADPDGTVGHGAVRVSNETIGGGSSFATSYNSRPVLAPFQSSDGSGGRFAEHPARALGIDLDFIYARLTGGGAFDFTPSGATFFGLPFVTGTFAEPGTFLPEAAHTGLLAADLALPNGVTIAAGSTLYSDFDGLEVNVFTPADYWYDTATNTEHRVFRGGEWAFFHEPSPGSFTKFGEYTDVTFGFDIQYVNATTATVTNTWSGTAVPVSGVLLPASGQHAFAATPTNLTGIMLNETVSPFTGFFGEFTGAMPIEFDVENASVVPEPSSLLLAGIGALLCAGLKRRRFETGDRRTTT